MWGKPTLTVCWWEHKAVQPQLKPPGGVLRDWKDLPCDPVIPFLGIYQNEMKSARERVISTCIFISA